MSKERDVLVFVIEAMLDTATGLSLLKRGIDHDFPADGCAVDRLPAPFH